MDEEDGRPGALAAMFGQADALMDALPLSLCRAHPLNAISFLRSVPCAASRWRSIACSCLSTRFNRTHLEMNL